MRFRFQRDAEIRMSGGRYGRYGADVGSRHAGCGAGMAGASISEVWPASATFGTDLRLLPQTWGKRQAHPSACETALGFLPGRRRTRGTHVVEKVAYLLAACSYSSQPYLHPAILNLIFRRLVFPCLVPPHRDSGLVHFSLSRSGPSPSTRSACSARKHPYKRHIRGQAIDSFFRRWRITSVHTPESASQSPGHATRRVTPLNVS